jgi:hypothetical protein
MPGPDIDFARIRPYGQPASRDKAFEELSCILLRNGVIEWPAGTRFFRFGNPDGGREGKGVLPNGEVWAWQSKYLTTFDASAAGQVTSSVKRALATEPNLKRYYVTLPIDLPAGDTDSLTSAHTRWLDKVPEWEKLAQERGMDVEFMLVNAHELISALTRAENEGRARYWFGADTLSLPWQRQRLEEAVATAGPRYTPDLHVEVSTVQALHAAGRTDTYVARWRAALAQLRDSSRGRWRSPTDVPAFEEALSRCHEALDKADTALTGMIAAAETSDELPEIAQTVADALAAVGDVDDLLHKHCLTDDRHFVNYAATLYTSCTSARAALHAAGDLASSVLTRAADTKRLVMTGRAGTGKTHLFCDVATQRLAQGRPTLFMLGQDFDATNLLPQVARIAGLDGGTETAIASFEAASEAAGHVGLLLIDALNDSDRPERWADTLRRLLTIVDRYNNVAVAVSCRTEFVDTVLGAPGLPTMEHRGFAEATDRAVRRFTHVYGLEPPTFPALNPEFGNPLFLKLTCEALQTLGATRFPLGSAGITTVLEAFLEAVNRRLSGAARCDYDEASDPVGRVVRELAQRGAGPYDRAEVRQLTESVQPTTHGWSRSLMRGLIAEGVLIEVGDGGIAFGYQRLGDILRARDLAEQGPEAVREGFEGIESGRWRERGLLGALAVLVPEHHQQEIFEVLAETDGGVRRDVVEAFLESLLLRGPTSITPRAPAVVEELLGDVGEADEVWDRLLRIACVPGHPLNADWLHAYLSSLDLVERDATWSQWLIGSGDDDRCPVTRLLDWAWPADPDQRRSLPDDVASLATTCLSWLLTTPDRRVRDRATKALTSTAERGLVGFLTSLGTFRGVNDPYITERLAGAVCGAALRSDDPQILTGLADGLAALLTDEPPLHLLTRDYARHVFETAQAHGWAGAAPSRSPGEWPISTRSAEEIDPLAGPPDYDYGSIWSSVAGLGDFGRYVLKPALRNLAVEHEQELAHDVERAVFDRVLELGWTPQRFQQLDQGHHGGHDGDVERVGKKYQWIALSETLGRLTDHLLARQPWDDDGPRPYEHAEQVVWRDIDPTLLARKPARINSPHELPWFAPVSAQFPDVDGDEYPSDMAGVPDSLELLAVTDAHGESWLVLAGDYRWVQQLPPEVAALGVPRHETWMRVNAYLVPTTQVDDLIGWARGKDWSEPWMPDIAEAHNVLLGAHPDGPGWESTDGTAEWREAAGGGPPPCEFRQCAVWYGGTGTSRDASAEEETRGYVPTRPLMDLGLAPGRDFRSDDSTGPAVLDPSVVPGGPPTLVIRRDLASRLQAAGSTVFWTVLVGRDTDRPPHQRPGDDYRWVTASASYILDGELITKVDSMARQCRPGPVTDHDVEWSLRPAEQ